MMAIYTCEHCGCTTNSLAVHTRKCPVLYREQYIAALDRGDGCIVSIPEWELMASSYGLLSRNGLRLALGLRGWVDVAAHFGLSNGWRNDAGEAQRKPPPEVAPQRRRARAALDAPLTDAERHACARRGATQFAGECGLHSHWRVVDVR